MDFSICSKCKYSLAASVYGKPSLGYYCYATSCNCKSTQFKNFVDNSILIAKIKCKKQCLPQTEQDVVSIDYVIDYPPSDCVFITEQIVSNNIQPEHFVNIAKKRTSSVVERKIRHH